MSAISIRPATTADALAYGKLLNAIDAESEYFMLCPEEADRSEAQRAYDIIDLAKRGVLMLAVDGDQVIGFARAEGELYDPLYAAIIALGVRRVYRRQGLGIRLMHALEAWGRRVGVHRLQLRVATENQPALALYVKFGFEGEGYMPNVLREDRPPVDMYVMVKWLVDEDA